MQDYLGVKMEYKTITLSVIIALLVSMGANYNDIQDQFTEKSPLYFCEARPELLLQPCDGGFSKYVHELGRCINNDAPNYICREGWVMVTNDMDIELPNYEIKLVQGSDGIYREQVIMHVN